MNARISLFAMLLSTAACGGASDTGGSGGGGSGDSPPEEGCSVSAQLSGAVEETIEWKNRDVCGSGRGTSNVTLIMGHGDPKAEYGFLIRMDLQSPTETGAKPVVVELGKGCGLIGENCAESWVTPEGACTLDIKTHEFSHEDEIFAHYTIAGPIACTAPAVSEGGTEVKFANFTISTTHLWDKTGEGGGAQ